MRYYGLTDIGKQREENQDKIYVPAITDDLKLFIIADGMGGVNGGNVASTDAVKNIREYIETHFNEINHEKEDIEELLTKAIKRANKFVFEKAKVYPEYKGMGTTMIVVIIYHNKAFIGHVGDSRVYRIRKNIIRQLTKDHSYVQELLKRGTITREEAQNHPRKNVLLKVLGCEKDVQPDVMTKGFLKDDILIMCTDGLTNMITEEEIYETTLKHKDYLKKVCNSLINNANLLGGYDNISVIVISND